MVSNRKGKIPDRYMIGQDLNWDAPWIDVNLWVQLPFWLMVDNLTIAIELECHEFQIIVLDDYFELYIGEVTDSRFTVCYRGPLKKSEDLSDEVKHIHKNNPNIPFMWRKCKTVLKIATRCNEDVWNKVTIESERVQRAQGAVNIYLEELCRAHIPVINKLIQGYRLATYDHFAFEIAPWDVPSWLIERNDYGGISTFLVPYRTWDVKPLLFSGFSPDVKPTGQPTVYQLINGEDLRDQISENATPGEFELLDALNLMERGNFSGAVRRVTTAIEVIVEALVFKEIEAKHSKPYASKFLKETQNKFERRVKKYAELSGRKLPKGLSEELSRTRKLRHRIVHQGYRISPGEQGHAHRSVDTGRWIFNWFENDDERRDKREKRIVFRLLGRERGIGLFPSKITPEGVVVSPPPGMDLFLSRP